MSLVLGGLMPFIVERGHDLNYYIFVVAAVIFFISFYASTLVRTTLQAIGLTLVLSLSLYLLFRCRKPSPLPDSAMASHKRNRD